MKKRLLFLAMALAICSASLTSCQEQYDNDRAYELCMLHSDPKDYTQSEIYEIEKQSELYVDKLEVDIDNILTEKSPIKRRKAMNDFVDEYLSDNGINKYAFKLMRILEGSLLSDKSKIRHLKARVVVVLQTVPDNL